LCCELSEKSKKLPRRSASLWPDARSVDDDGMTPLAQAAQKRLGQGGIAEEVLPGRVRSFLPWIRSSQRSADLPRPIVCRVTEPLERTTIRVLSRRPLFTLFDKDEMADLTAKQRAILKDRLKDELKSRRQP